jgi:hypothetical protein
MLIFFKMILVLILMIFLLRKRIQIGHAVFTCSLLLFFLTSPDLHNLLTAFQATLFHFTTWNMVITLYLVMCLENLLRTSGILKSFTAAARKIFGSERALLVFMPSFLGFLPSLGGAIFSAPMVYEAGKRYRLSPELNTTINYWFRHIWQFCNPILPAILLASAFTHIPLGKIIAHQFIFSLAALLIGILFLLTGKAYATPLPEEHWLSPGNTPIENNPPLGDNPPAENNNSPEEAFSSRELRNSIILAAGPILANVFLVVFFNLNTALAMGLVLMAMVLILKFNLRQIKNMLASSLDYRIEWGVISILFFQNILNVTGTIDGMITFFQSSGIPGVAVVCLVSFFVALSTSIDQSFVAVAFPLIGALSGDSLNAVAAAYLCGTAGMMLSPTHLCLLVSVEYFKANFFKSLRPVILMEIILVAFGFSYLFWF